MAGKLSLFLALPLFLLTACGSETPESSEETGMVMQTPAPEAEVEAAGPALAPLPGYAGEVPELSEKTTVIMTTEAGDITIDVYPAAAPNAAARFVELVQAGFYDNTPVFRVVPGFVAQFGINWREEYPAWQDNNFDDDPTIFALDRGTLAFAKAGPNTNSTQVFINYVQNNHLAAPQYNFTTFAVVTEGMEVVESFIPVGAPGGGLDQFRLWNDGDAYLESLETKPVMILQARVVTD